MNRTDNAINPTVSITALADKEVASFFDMIMARGEEKRRRRRRRNNVNYVHKNHALKSTKLRMVIGGWTDYYVNHFDDRVAFNVHGERVNVYDINPDSDDIVFQWGFNSLLTTVGEIVNAMTLIDKWLEV